MHVSMTEQDMIPERDLYITATTFPSTGGQLKKIFLQTGPVDTALFYLKVSHLCLSDRAVKSI